MKNLADALRSRLSHLFQQTAGEIDISSKTNLSKTEDECLVEEPIEQPEEQSRHKGILKRIVQKLKSAYQQPIAKTQQYKKASLFPDGKTTNAALSLVLRGVAEILSQKMDMHWTEADSVLRYEKEVFGGQGKICYYLTDNPEAPQPETLAQEAGKAAIEQFDPRAGAIHLIYCAQVANLEKPWEQEFVIDDKQLLDYTGLVKRTDLCKQEKLETLYKLLRQPAQILACVAWPKQGKVGAFTIADLRIWDVTVIREYDTDQDGKNKLTRLKVIGRPGVWTKYFLNKSEYYYQTGIITKRTVQKLFSIGKQNAGAARILIWLTFQIQPGEQNCIVGKTLMEIAYGSDRVEMAQRDRQLRRQMADDFETDLKVVKEAGWQLELVTGPAWLMSDSSTKRPIGFWSELTNAEWRFNLPEEAQDRLTSPRSQNKAVNVQKKQLQPPSGNAIREARKAKGWSRAFFAATMGKSISWVDAIETGHRNVSGKDLPKLMEKLNLH